MKKATLKKPYTLRNGEEPSTRVQAPHDPHEILTQQHMKEETDINVIVNKHIQMEPDTQRQPIFGDFSSINFQEMQNSIADINQSFESLPARVRKKFDNDPYQIIRFVENPANKDEAIRLGLIVNPNPETPLPDVGTPTKTQNPQQMDLVKEAEKPKAP